MTRTVEQSSFRPDSQFRVFLEAAPDAIVVIDRDGTIVLVNQLAGTLFGYPEAEMLGQKIEVLVPERFGGSHRGHRADYFAEPRTRPMGEGLTLAGRRRDGSEFPIEISLSPLQSDGGPLVISIIRDVTQRVQLEARVRGLLESAPDAIVVVDGAATITIVNSQTERMFGYRREELIGQPVEILVPERLRDRHATDRDRYIDQPVTRPMGAGRLLTGRKKDGSEFPVEISLSPLQTEKGTLVTSIIRDITDRRLAEERLQASLREKEALLKEIHHRVKNNLQITSSLLHLQADFVEDPRVRGMLEESQNRIRSMALVHEKLYRASDLSRIDFPEYVRSLTLLLLRSFGVREETISVSLGGNPVFLSIESAVPCGLLVNELLSNALKHAFPGGRRGAIRVSVEEREGEVRLTVADDGVGLPAGFDPWSTETLGLRLVQTLVRQLAGRLSIERAHGTVFHIAFAEHKAVIE